MKTPVSIVAAATAIAAAALPALAEKALSPSDAKYWTDRENERTADYNQMVKDYTATVADLQTQKQRFAALKPRIASCKTHPFAPLFSDVFQDLEGIRKDLDSADHALDLKRADLEEVREDADQHMRDLDHKYTSGRLGRGQKYYETISGYSLTMHSKYVGQMRAQIIDGYNIEASTMSDMNDQYDRYVGHCDTGAVRELAVAILTDLNPITLAASHIKGRANGTEPT